MRNLGISVATGAILLLAGSVLFSPSDGGTESKMSTPPTGVVPRTDRFAIIGEPCRDDSVNGARLEKLFLSAKARGARYVLTPEVRLDEDANRISGPDVNFVANLARTYKLWVLLSLVESANEEDHGHFVTLVLLDHNGLVVDQYRKIMVRPGEVDKSVKRGDYRQIIYSVDDGGQRLGILEGDDIQAGVPRLATVGAQTILIVAAWEDSDGIDWDKCCRELSKRYMVNLVVCNRPTKVESKTSVVGLDRVYLCDGTATVHERCRNDGLFVVSIARRQSAWKVETGLGMPASVPSPTFELATGSIAELGRKLFVDKNLSSSKKVACSSCHEPEEAFTNGKQKGIGVYGEETKRNVPSLLNVGFRPLLRWDGYASTLENFVKYPLSDSAEMNFHYLDEALPYIKSKAEYVSEFRKAFGSIKDIDFHYVERAIATYLRTLISSNSPFDRYFYGHDRSAIGTEAKRGLQLFLGKAQCVQCHMIGSESALFMDFKYHFQGVGFDPQPGSSFDTGLGDISTNDLSGFFQTPSLRNVALTAPYMHDGSMATLEDVVEFYNGGGFPEYSKKSGLVPLNLSEGEIRDLVAFLKSLTGDQHYDGFGHRQIDR